jgi:sigma-E factor negative regulatory protein RseC
MRETGEVVGADGAMLTVRMKRSAACSRCGACAFGESGDLTVSVRNGCGAKEHDRVVVELRSESFVKAALIMYGLPLIGLVSGIAAGSFIFERIGLGKYSDPAGFVLGFALIAAIHFLIKKHEPSFRKKDYSPVAVSVEESHSGASIPYL